ncbi:MAG: hypothetical protein JO032_06370 [Alphaproteobacteria bacterium]|nr:hypothetical protein [Alphaproteobacteria bacterium]
MHTVTTTPAAAGLVLTARTAQAQTGAFDGAWQVQLYCPAMAGLNAAFEYTCRFPARLSGGHFRGGHGAAGAPGCRPLDGAIAPDGAAELRARGLAGRPPQTLERERGGTPCAHGVSARFAGARGSGARTDGRRACTVTFTR